MSGPGKTVILGAGAAGLAVAHELSERSAEVTVIERNEFVGGLCRTIRFEGYSFDLGGHRWFTKNEDLNQWLRRLMGDELIMVDRISRIYYGGKYFLYPIDISDLLKQSSPLVMLHAGLAFLWSALRQSVAPRPPSNMKDAYISQFGSRLYEMFFRRYTEKVWGRPCEKLSPDWVSQRTRGLSIWTLIQDSLGSRGPKVASLIDSFMYPRDGFSRIPERMAEDIRARGGRICLGSPVTRLVYHGPHDFELHYSELGNVRSIRCNSVVSTIPVSHLAQILVPAPDRRVVTAANSLEFRDLVTVNLILARERVSADTWLYVQDSDVLFGRLHEPKNWSGAMVPDPACTSLVLECFCSQGDGIWSMSDQDIVRRCVDDLENRLGLIKASEVKDALVIRTTDAYPVYDLQYRKNLGAVTGFLAGFRGLHYLGRSGSFRYNNADHSMEMGLLLGRKLLGSDVDHMAVNTEPHYHEIRADDEEIGHDRYVFEKSNKDASVEEVNA